MQSNSIPLVAVEDDPNIVLLIQLAFSPDKRFTVRGGAPSASAGIELVGEVQPALIILDHFIDGPITGLRAAPDLKLAAPDAKILLFTSHDLRVEVEREPAVDGYLSKNELFNLPDTVRGLLGTAPVPAA
jgi:DNA-binding NarL/FixJ family response regulator